MNVTNTTAIPIAGTPAYWTAQREAVALVQAWKDTELPPEEELDLLRRIAAHGFASRMMAAHGADVARWVMILETLRELFDDDDDDNEGDDSAAAPNSPPHGSDWCKRGCQILYSMECGMCGYDGPGVSADQVETVAEYCCHCKARTYQSQASICTLCGKDAETPDAPAPQAALCLRDCQPVDTDPQCALCRGLERNARGAVAAAEPACRTVPQQAAPTLGVVDGQR